MAPSLVLFVFLMIMPALLHRVALAGDRKVRVRRWLALDEEPAQDAVRGYKTAQVMVSVDGQRAALWGITVGGSYTVEDTARCVRRGCAAPALDCDCGFYAFKRRAEAVDLLRRTLGCNGLRDKALLAVDLDGSVLQYERGYRAERQRVLGVQFERDCSRCREAGIGRRATCLAASPEFRIPSFGRLVGAASPTGMLPVRPVCDRHVPGRGHVYGLAGLAGLLRTDVGWLP